LITRTPRPFICSKSTRDFTLRMNMTISTGRMSAPVAIACAAIAAFRSVTACQDVLNRRRNTGPLPA